MYKIKETIIVEGTYDKIKLSGFIDGIIFITGGFTVFTNKAMQKSIRTFAEKTGIVILTDSDSAGIKIRNFVAQLVPPDCVKHAYVPEIAGKERRKIAAGKEGLLGVEGISPDIILNSLKSCGCTINGSYETPKTEIPITKADLFLLGLSGGKDSAALRKKLLLELGLPSKISANMMLDAINRLLTKSELINLLENIRKL